MFHVFSCNLIYLGKVNTREEALNKMKEYLTQTGNPAYLKHERELQPYEIESIKRG